MKKVFTIVAILMAVAVLSTQPVLGSDFKFAVIADPHMSVAGPNSPGNSTKMFKQSVELLQSAIKAINEEGGVDFVVALGDLTKDSEPWNVDRFKEVMAELNMPYYVVLGNHDVSPVDTMIGKMGSRSQPFDHDLGLPRPWLQRPGHSLEPGSRSRRAPGGPGHQHDRRLGRPA